MCRKLLFVCLFSVDERCVRKMCDCVHNVGLLTKMLHWKYTVYIGQTVSTLWPLLVYCLMTSVFSFPEVQCASSCTRFKYKSAIKLNRIETHLCAAIIFLGHLVPSKQPEPAYKVKPCSLHSCSLWTKSHRAPLSQLVLWRDGGL